MSPVPETGVTDMGFVPVQSYEHFLLNNLPIHIKDTHGSIPIPAFVRLALQGTTRQLFLVGIDPGNSGAKYALFNPTGKIVTHYVPAVVAGAQELAAGTSVTTYQRIIQKSADGQKDSEEVVLPGDWFGTDAIEHRGTSLPTGSTRERVNDPRYAPFLMAGFIALFEKAGYAPGNYDLIGCWGARMEEMRETASGPKLDEATKKAIDTHFLNKTWKFRRIDQWGAETTWSFTLRDLVPGPQSYAGFHLWHKRPDGHPAQDIIHGVVEIDFGAFDLHRLVIDCTPGKPITATRERVGDGMIIELIQPFAKRLKDEFGIGELDDAIAFKWFMDGTARVGGFIEDVSAIVEEVRGKQIPAIIARAFKGAQLSTEFYRMKGGGVLLMKQELRGKMEDLRRKPQTYCMITDPTENAAGLLSILDLMARSHK